MGLHSVEYNYNSKNITVKVSNCTVKIDIFDQATNNLVYNCEHKISGTQSVWATLTSKYHVDYLIKVYINGSLEHIEKTSIKNKTVIVRLDSVAIGDCVCWFPYVIEFQKKYGCNVLVSTFHNYLFKHFEHARLTLIGPDDMPAHDICYKIGIFEDSNLDPINFRIKPLQKCPADILSIPYRELHLDLNHLAGVRPIEEKYVVINTNSTMDCKEWQNKRGWQEVVDTLTKCFNYKVVCIPDPSIKLDNLHKVNVPKDLISGALTYIAHADFMVGLSSGLSWIARTVNTPVIMISGFTEPFNEFKSGIHRVINRKACHGCYHDLKVKYDRYRHWCPRNKQFECSKKIGAQDVIDAIQSLCADRPVKKKKIMCILPHCSTGGLPQYFLEKLIAMRNNFDTYVVEWSFHGEAYNIQRKQIREACTEFIEIGNKYRQDFLHIVDDIVPDFIHFEEFPSMFSDNAPLLELHVLHRYPLIHTSHTYTRQNILKADKYIFPSAFQKTLYPELQSTVIEYPIFDKFCPGDKESNIILNVGIVSPHKNQQYLVDLAKVMPGLTFVFIGSLADNFRQYWEPLIKSAPKNCIFLGQQNQEQITEWYKKSGVLFHSSLTELCPIVFNEAISIGLPILCNWLPSYEHLSYAQVLNKAVMDKAIDAESIRTLLKANRVQATSTYESFVYDVNSIYR